MARNVARLKMGYYPLPASDAEVLCELLHFPEHSSAIDPCVGTGAALETITHGATVDRHGVELDTERAEQAVRSGIRTIQGNAFDAHAKVESFSILYLNPPYDSEINLTGNRRLERLFLEHCYRWLVPRGVLIFVIPYDQVSDCASLLSDNFSRLTVLRLGDPEARRFRQVVVLGERKHLRGAAIEENRRRLRTMVPRDGYEMLPELAADAVEPYKVPASVEATLLYRGLPYNEIEDLLPSSAAWKQVAPVLFHQSSNTVGRPITPLHGGHVGLLCTAGLLNGVFGEGEERHIAYWRAVKHVTEYSEKEGDVTIVRRREKWANELRLIYATGRTQKLTEIAPAEKGESDGECASETRAT
jgi:hypothetical protein